MVNAYLVDAGETTLVDAGTPNAADDLRGELDEAGYGAGDVDRVLITHFDLDHVGTLALLAFDGPIYAMEPHASFLDGSGTPPLSNHKGVLQRLTDFWLTRPSTPVERLTDGDSVAGFDVITHRGTRPDTPFIFTRHWASPLSVISYPKRMAPLRLRRGCSRTAHRRTRTVFGRLPIPISPSTSPSWATGRRSPRTEAKRSSSWLDD